MATKPGMYSATHESVAVPVDMEIGKFLDRVVNQSDFMIRYRVHWKKKLGNAHHNFCLVKSATRLLCLYLLFFSNNGSFTFFLSFCIYLFVY